MFLVLLLCTIASPSKMIVHCAVGVEVDASLDVHALGSEQLDGFGAVSAGASSRLLMDYEPELRDQILDYLFLPNFGAAMQVLKVEIGGDTISTCGSEPSHRHSRNEAARFDRGWEWWLMKEAVKRNPSIRLGALAWGAPGWLAPDVHVESCLNFTCTERMHLCNCNAYTVDAMGKPVGCVWNSTFASYCPYFSRDTAHYIVEWLKGAHDNHNLTIDFVGLWNERMFLTNFILTLREELDKSGLSRIRLVATDNGGGYNLTDKFLKDFWSSSKLRSAVDIIGIHYPQDGTTQAHATGKVVWSSEDWSQNASWDGAASLAEAFTSNWVLGRRTAVLAWSPICSWYSSLAHYAHGFMIANEPWSGAYSINPPVWIAAHFTQFTSIGDYLLPVGSGSGVLPHGYGSYVSIRRAFGTWSSVFHTMSAPANATVPLKVHIHLVQAPMWETVVHVWRTSRRKGIVFRREEDIRLQTSDFTVTLDTWEILSLTTASGAVHGIHPFSPAPAPFPLPYSDNFDLARGFSTPKYFFDQMGSFETSCIAPGTCVLRQMAPTRPIEWTHGSEMALTVIGDVSWADISVSVTIDFNAAASGALAFVCGRVRATGDGYNEGQTPPGYCLHLHKYGKWLLVAGKRRIGVGQIANSSASRHRCAVVLRGSSVKVMIDGVTVVALQDGEFTHGQAVLGCSWAAVEYDDFRVDAITPILNI